MANTEKKIELLRNKIKQLNIELGIAYSTGDEDAYDKIEDEISRASNKLENLLNK